MGGLSIRQTTADDQELIEGLLLGARWKHVHLDWLEPSALADHPPFLIALENELPVACLACPPDVPGVCWIRTFAVMSGTRPEAAWRPLWAAAGAPLHRAQVSRVAALPIEAWFETILAEHAFRSTNAVVFFECDPVPGLPPAAFPSRAIETGDHQAVLALDHAAFGPMWQLSPESLEAALEQAELATVIEAPGVLVGYQITTRSPFGAHLARLAVSPAHQGQGFGRALVLGVLHHLIQAGLSRLSVNTQADNLGSQRLYRSLGFRETGQRYPVFELELPGL